MDKQGTAAVFDASPDKYGHVPCFFRICFFENFMDT